MGEEEFILLPTSEFRGVDTINLDDVEKILLAKVDWPELSENIRLIQGTFFFDSFRNFHIFAKYRNISTQAEGGKGIGCHNLR